ncbi:MAG: dipeptide epimerase [Planctomycetaceae bacterium]|jgi:L-alanine-DL-glutamate epimerase-like enolase superfamily enzyme|nr:dipeptide epimerase [Planctomycetaceae bacterium]
MKQNLCNRRTFLTASTFVAASTVFLKQNEVLTAPVANEKMAMKLSFRPYELKLNHPFTLATSTRTATPGVQVEIEFDGKTGYGEAALPPYLGESAESVSAFLKRINLTAFANPFETEDILDYVDKITENNTAAKAAVDIALHDLIGKLLGVPCYRLFGLSPQRIPPTTFTISIAKPDVIRTQTKDAAQKFKMLKVKLGRDNDKEIIETIRSVTDLPLIVDVNQGWKDKRYALDNICWLKERGIIMVEQPLPKSWWEEAGWLTERSPLPIFADESLQRISDVMKIKGYFSGINIKLMKCTGMREAWKMINLARVCHLGVMLGCMTETSCAIAAAVHLSPAVDFVDLDGNLLISNDLFQGVRLENGRQLPTDLPGLGIKKIEQQT